MVQSKKNKTLNGNFFYRQDLSSGIKWDRAKIVLTLMLLVIVILYGVRLYIIVDHVSDGIELGEYQDEIHTLDTQNLLLEQQLLPLESYQNIASRAAQMGFVDCHNCDWYVK